MKNIQTQIILIFTIIGLAVLIGLGVFYNYQLQMIEGNVLAGQDITETIANEVKQLNEITLYAVVAFMAVAVVVGLFVRKIIIKPMYKLTKNANEIAEGKMVDMDNMMPDKIRTDIKIFNKLDLSMNIEKIIYLENWTSTEQKINLHDRYVNLLFAPFKDENDRPGGVIAVIQDITEHVRLDNMRKEFVADVSHELKTPITSIMGYADTLLEGEYEKDIQERFLGVISSEAKRMARLVNDLLTLSKYDNKQNKCEKTEFDLGELVKQTQESLELEVKKKNQHIECYVTANVPMVYADKYGIERVVINILTNSIKYTPEGGNIKIYVGFVYNDAYIKIIDNGIGIPEKDLSRIFERFYRVDKARTRAMGGTGLGLSIAKEILDQNGGSMDIKSVQDKGTEVVIRVPTKAGETRQKIEE